jgi:hypothetical protein
MPLILVDAATVYILYERSRRASALYALSPYSIFVTAVWGIFDNITALFLLLSISYFQKSRYSWSGFFFGLSLVKQYAVLALPAYILQGRRSRDMKGMVFFLLGLGAAMCPTLYFLCFYLREFIYMNLVFHSYRIGGGLTPLNALWNVHNMPFGSGITQAVVAVWLVAYGLTILFSWTRKLNLADAAVSMLLCYLAFGKVINEQYLLSVYPFMLMKWPKLTTALGNLSVIFGIVRSTPIYWAYPLLQHLNTYQILRTSWYAFQHSAWVDVLYHSALFTLGTLFFIAVAASVLRMFVRGVPTNPGGIDLLISPFRQPLHKQMNQTPYSRIMAFPRTKSYMQSGKSQLALSSHFDLQSIGLRAPVELSLQPCFALTEHPSGGLREPR